MPTLTLADGFLAAILAEPDDDAHRLIFADWLEDAGQTERAEFVRLQCRLAVLLARRGEANPEKSRQGRKLIAAMYRRETERSPYAVLRSVDQARTAT